MDITSAADSEMLSMQTRHEFDSSAADNIEARIDRVERFGGMAMDALNMAPEALLAGATELKSSLSQLGFDETFRKRIMTAAKCLMAVGAFNAASAYAGDCYGCAKEGDMAGAFKNAGYAVSEAVSATPQGNMVRLVTTIGKMGGTSGF